MKIWCFNKKSNSLFKYETTLKFDKCLTYGEPQHYLSRLPSALLIQQNYCDNFSDSEWHEYDNRSNQFQHIEKNIAFALFGPPTCLTTSNSPDQNIDLAKIGYTTDQIKHVQKIYNNILSFAKYSAGGNRIYLSKLFICCVPLLKIHSEYIPDINIYSQIETSKIGVSPLFKIRKCIRSDNNNPNPCCSYIDDHGRVYKNWKDYLTNNKQPKGVLILPKDGKYYNSKQYGFPQVCLDIKLSPASSISTEIQNTCNKIATGLGLASIGVFATAIFAPVAAPIIFGATAASVITGAYGTTVSSLTLKDRRKHQQSINITDAEARACWLNIGASTLGVAAGASGQILAARVGSGIVIGKVAQGAHNSILFASLFTNGCGIANGSYTMFYKYKTGEKPTAMEWLHMSTSVLFFCHSIVNIKTATTIVEENQASVINRERSMLRSNRHRKMFDKMAAETRRKHGDNVAGNAEVIRSMKIISDKDTFFASALRVNKQLNQNKIRISFSGTDEVSLNNQHNFKPDILISLKPSEKTELFRSIGPSKLASKNFSTKVTFLQFSSKIPFSCNLSMRNIVNIVEMCSSPERLEDILINCIESLTEYALNILFNAILELRPIVYEKMSALGCDTKNVLCEIFKIMVEIIKLHKFPNETFDEFLKRLADSPNSASKYLARQFSQWLRSRFADWRRSNCDNDSSTEITCKICHGSRFSN